MILVDSSVCIDQLRDRRTASTVLLEALGQDHLLAIPDLALAEVLRGLPHDWQFRQARVYLAQFPMIQVGGEEEAVAAARCYRRLSALGVTVRGTIDCLIAARCLADDHQLLTSDRDFAPFATHFGLRLA